MMTINLKKAAAIAGWCFMIAGFVLYIAAFAALSSDHYFPGWYFAFLPLMLFSIGAFALAMFLNEKLCILAWIMIFIAFLSGINVAFVTSGAAREGSMRISCSSNLKQIGLGLKQYALDYGDFFPPANGAAGIEMLRSNNYITDYKLFICPSNWHDPGKGAEPLKEDTCDYVYIGGLSESCSPDSIIAYDKPNNHWRYGNVLFVDGHVQGFKGSNWLEKAGQKQNSKPAR